MDIRKLIKEEVQKVLVESYAGRVLPTQFNHLKWKLNGNQKYYLQDLCEVNPDSLNESDIKNASNFLGIPESNIKSIINTYNTYNPLSEASRELSKDSPFLLGNKPVTVADSGMNVHNSNRAPERANRTTYPIQDKMTQAEKRTMDYAIKKNRVIDKAGNFKDKERQYEGIKTSLMMYLFCELNPKDIGLNHRGQIQIDQEPVLEEHETFNMENHTFRKVKTLLKSFNKLFNCNFRISEHVDLSESNRCHRTMIELFGLAKDRWYWDSSEKEWVKPGDERYNGLKEQYIENDGMDRTMPEIPVINHKEMLKKYFNGDLISYDSNADWLL